MHTIVAAFSTAAQVFTAAQAVGAHYLVTLTEAGGAALSASVDLGQTTVTFPDVPVGHWVGSIVLVDANSTPLEPAVASDAFDVVDAPATVLLDVPVSLTISQQ